MLFRLRRMLRNGSLVAERNWWLHSPHRRRSPYRLQRQGSAGGRIHGINSCDPDPGATATSQR